MRCNGLWLSMAVALAVLVAGCAPAPSGAGKSSVAAPKDKVETTAAKHDHSAPGKHGGQQQLLGNHEYHAELASNETSGEVAVYVTDGEFKPVAVPEKTVFLTAVIGGQPKEYTLANEASPSGGQPRFVLVDKTLAEFITDGKGSVRFNATIKGKPYAATYTPSSEAGHDHGHGEKPGDKHDEH